jgi:ribosome biogenesis GTPase A
MGLYQARLTEKADQIIKIVQARYGLKDKSAAINYIAERFGGYLLEPKLRPDYVEKLDEFEKEDIVLIGTPENFRKRYGSK